VRAVNLIPTEQRPGAGGTYGRSGGAAYAVVVAALGLAGMGALWLKAHHDAADANAQVAQITAQATAAQSAATSLSSYGSFVSMSGTRVAGIEELAQDRFDWAHAFHELGRVLPFDVTLSNVSGTLGTTAVPGAAAPTPPTGTTGPAGSSTSATSSVVSASPAGSVPTLAITGCTANQTRVAYTMQRLALIDGATNVTLGSSTNGSGASGSTTAPGCGDTFSITVTFNALPTVSATAATGASPSEGAVIASTPAPAGPARQATVATGSTASTTGPSGAAPATAGATGATGVTGATGTAPSNGS
jgi:hypothetical protein